jgi:hypothetical protein
VANGLIINVGPFQKIDLTEEQSYLPAGTAHAANNADIITQPNALLTVLGRAILGTLNLTPDNTVTALGRYETFEGQSNATPFNRVFYIFSAIDSHSVVTCGAYEVATAATTIFPNLRPFTQSIQMGDMFLTNSGQQVRRRPWAAGGWLVDEIQVAVPPQIFGAVRSVNAGDSPGDGTYNYALAFKTSAPDGDPTIVESSSPFYFQTAVNITAGTAASGQVTLSINGATGPPQAGDRVALHINHQVVSVVASGAEGLDGLTNELVIAAQANSIINSLVTLGANTPGVGGISIVAVKPGTSGNAITYRGGASPGTVGHAIISPTITTHLTSGSPGQAPTITIPTTAVLATTYGGQTVEAYLYRFSVLQPLYLEVGAVKTLATASGGGNTVITDTTPDIAIAGNTPLVNGATGSDHHDPPPFATTLVQVNNNAPTTAQTTWYVENPGFVEVHKGRLWAFVLYPNLYNLKTGTSGVNKQPTFTSLKEVQLQSQLWFSDFATPWSNNEVDDVLTIGDETTPGNDNWGPSLATPQPQGNPAISGWDYGINIDNIPKNLAKAGTYLCAFKSQTMHIVTGDDPNTFRVYETFNIGMLASLSMAKGEGGVFWLAPPYHFHFYAGGEPLYIGEEIRRKLESLSQVQLASCLSFFAKRRYVSLFNIGGGKYLGFVYYVPQQKWLVIDLGATAVFATPQAAVVAVANQLALWDGDVQDLGRAITATWTTGVMDSGTPGQVKRYRYCVVDAPIQPGVVGSVAVKVDMPPQTVWNSPAIDLGHGPTSKVISLPQTLQGYTAVVTVALANTTGSGQQAVLRRVNIYGDVAHDLKDNQLRWQI